MAFVENGKLNLGKILEAQSLNARMSYRVTLPDLELIRWDNMQKRDRLLGCSLTGWQDMVNATNMDIKEQKEVLNKLKDIATSSVQAYDGTQGQKLSVFFRDSLIIS